ncbi:MAG: amidohydrolase [Bacteroidales bacterium]|nr:amidohydrolase [Bacteroidales bacterium]
MDFKDQINSLVTGPFMEEMTAIRRYLHQHPELSFTEHKTSAYIRQLLDQWGIKYQFPVVETGILAMISGGGRGSCIAVRSDMDALPVTEKSGVEFESLNQGIMHACGHDVHMASLLGVIRILDQIKDHLNGTILFVFQPGEEKVPGGAKLMLEEGIFEGRQPDLILAQHVLPDMEAGHVGFKPGIYMASSDEIYITVKGKGGHGALPQQINDPVLMASHILISLQQEINRRSPSGVPTVLSFGKVVADGAVNVIPDQVELEGTFRTMNEAWRKKAHHLVQQIASGIASSMGGTCQVEIRHGYPVLHNHEVVTLRALDLARSFLGTERVEDMEIRMTAEDFAWFAQSVPGMMYRLGVKEPGQEEVHQLHTAGFRVDESALKTGISLLAYLSAELLQSRPG